MRKLFGHKGWGITSGEEEGNQGDCRFATSRNPKRRGWTTWGMKMLVAMMVLGGRGVRRDCVILRKWLVSLVYEGRDLTIGWK